MEETKKEAVPRCTGSYRLGTACGLCERCKVRGFDLAAKEAAIAAEVERTKDLPADRVKPKGQQVTVNIGDEKINEMKEEIKDELKPEIKKEVKDEVKDQLEEKAEEDTKPKE